VSIPVRIVIDWEKIRLCKKDAEILQEELNKYIGELRNGNPIPIDGGKIIKMLCQECFNRNTANNVIRLELDPKVIRNE